MPALVPSHDNQKLEAETRFLVPRPMEDHGIYAITRSSRFPRCSREFAKVNPTEAGFAAFANKYGSLGC